MYTPVLYDRLPEVPVIDPESPDYLMQGMSAMQALDWQSAATDVVATLDTLRSEPGVAKVGPVDWRTYDGAGHAFDNPNPMFHDAAASAAAWPVTLDFLAEHLLAPTVE